MPTIQYHKIAANLRVRGWDVNCPRCSDKVWLATGEHPYLLVCVGAGRTLGEALTDLDRECRVQELRATLAREVLSLAA
jgi:ribosomal protein S27AE